MSDSVEKFGGLFLGPKAENRAVLTEMLVHTVVDHFLRRARFQETDPPLFSLDMQEGQDYQAILGRLRKHMLELLSRLGHSVPWYSPRYMAHMNSDVLIPAVVGYLSAMIHNPNNVVAESSPATSSLEVEAIDALLRLAGFPGCLRSQSNVLGGWGHFTSGGHVANIEALWAARNLKYFPLALQRCVGLGVDIPIRLPNNSERSLFIAEERGGKEDVQQDRWELLNVTFDEVLNLRGRLISVMIEQYEQNGFLWLPLAAEQDAREEDRGRIRRIVDQSFSRESGLSVEGLWSQWACANAGVVLTAATSHYSVSKALEILGMGRGNLIKIPVTKSFRMDVKALRAKLIELADQRKPIIALVAVFGSTEEGAVDPLDAICDLRDEMAEERGLYFPIHVDAAYGGYLRCLFRGSDDRELTLNQARSFVGYGACPTSNIYKAQAALRRTESITIDPHKHGYVPYPAGCVLFRDERIRDLISFQAPYLWRDTQDVLVGSFTLEGSRPGATAASVWLTQKVLPLSSQGHGELIRGSIRNAQMLYHELLERSPLKLASGQTVCFFPICEPDFTTVCFVANAGGNDRLCRMNCLVDLIAERFSCTARPDRYPASDYYVAQTRLRYSEYGESLRHLLNGIGIRPSDYSEELEDDERTRPANYVSAIRMCVMHPWHLVRVGEPEADYVSGFLNALSEFLAEVDLAALE